MEARGLVAQDVYSAPWQDVWKPSDSLDTFADLAASPITLLQPEKQWGYSSPLCEHISWHVQLMRYRR